MPRVSKWTIGAAVTVVAALAMLTMSFASAEGITVSVTPTGVAITIGDGDTGFGPEAMGDTVTTEADLDGDHQTITNAGATAIGNISVGYSNEVEATCGTGWQANASAIGVDQFVMSAKTDQAFGVIPVWSDNTGDIQAADITISGANSTQRLDFELQLPDSVTTGSAQCTIFITVTAAG